MSSMYWGEHGYHRPRRRALDPAELEAMRQRKAAVRQMARFALLIALVIVGLLTFEIGRKAISVIHNAQLIERLV